MLLQALYFFVPSYIANMAPVLVKKIKFLDYPADFGKSWKGNRILGSHKTLRGFFFGTLFALITFEIQRILYSHNILKSLALIDYAASPFYLGALIGFSALFGDSIKSFFKRRLGIQPGHPWIPFDQIDFLVVSIIITAFFSKITLLDSLLALALVFFLTLIVQYISFRLKLKEDIL
jgi:CDP-2,3-bis-(O-geranylgeranyl)-sn-glycerol synthase